MKEIFDSVREYLPQYLRSLGRLLCRPKTFIAAQVKSPEPHFPDAVAFVATSGVVVVLVTASVLNDDQAFWRHLVGRLAQVIVGGALAAAFLRGAWWLVGGRAKLLVFFEVCAYLIGGGIIILAVLELLAEGVLMFDRDLYRAVRGIVSQPGTADQSDLLVLLESNLGRAFLLISGMGFIVPAVWGMVSWGSFRQISGLSRSRSVAAFVISLPLMVVAAITVFMLGMVIGRWEVW